MSDATASEGTPSPKMSKLPLIIGLLLAFAGGGGGFYAVTSGLILDSTKTTATAETSISVVKDAPLPDVSYVSLPQLVVSLGPGSDKSHLIFRADLEVPSKSAEEVRKILPRVVDVLNSYLRALEPRDIEAPAALIKLRGQMLRRVQLVTGEGRVRDLLVMEFVLN